MKTEIRLSQDEYNKVIEYLSGRREFTFDTHQKTYGNDMIALHHFFEDILYDFGFDLPDHYINIEIEGK
ncbi:hypothetical protein OO184_10860 [Photorhabdus sp. APURE]|uniref:hypothetical protein n=1 Tax=Photorhabdus aballayi TaxID=2991723 RepID=UPI00223D5C22|nr:hypothetical protein [Photorhabdus aballayi]MCW7548428.1 hypothetical protein [Photorhabdus aballayi]